RDARLRTGERSARVDLVHEIEPLHRRRERTGQADRARIVDQDIDAAERLDRTGDRAGDLILEANIAGQGQRLSPGRLDLLRSRKDGARKLRMRLRRLGRDRDIGPSRAARSPMASPMPRLAPVMKSVLPCRLDMRRPYREPG